MVGRYAPLGHTLQCPVKAPDGGREVSAGQGTGRRFRTRANCLPRKGDDRPTAAVVTRAPFYASERPARAKGAIPRWTQDGQVAACTGVLFWRPLGAGRL